MPKKRESFFRRHKVEERLETLDEQQKALLLAMAQVEAEAGRTFSEEDEQLLSRLRDEVTAAGAIEAAVQRLVSTPADPRRKLSWEELKRR